jgi:hypothetical protein
MPEQEDFQISYKGQSITVSSVLNGGNIFFVVHLAKDIIIAESMEGEDWFWYEVGKGQTVLAAELGSIIEAMDI